MTDRDKARHRGTDVRRDDSGDNVGRRPADGIGVVQGSGAGAGGGGATEDFDSDPVGGGGEAQMPVSNKGTGPAVNDEDGKPTGPDANRTSGDGRARTTGE